MTLPIVHNSSAIDSIALKDQNGLLLQTDSHITHASIFQELTLE